jgi:hypothetical protein
VIDTRTGGHLKKHIMKNGKTAFVLSVTSISNGKGSTAPAVDTNLEEDQRVLKPQIISSSSVE